jgi:2-dehydropantoate 2-reductase
VGNPLHVDKIQEGGLKLVTQDAVHLLRIPACKTAHQLRPFVEDDVVLLTAKSQHTPTCLGQLKIAGAPRRLPIFCAQNSIWNEPFATRVFDRVYGVMVRVPGIFLRPGEVINPLSGTMGYLDVGLHPSGSDELAEKVALAFRKAGFAGGVNCFILRTKAAKCLRNLGNAMGAITDGKGDSSEFMLAARAEAMKIWGIAGIEWEAAEEFDRRTSEEVSEAVMPEGYEHIRNRGSSWQSLMRSTGNIEAEQLNGDIVNLGRLLGVETPYNEVLWRVSVEMAENGARPGKYSVDDLMALIRKESATRSVTNRL